MHYDTVVSTEVRAYLDASEQHHTSWGMVHGGLCATVIESLASVGASQAVREEGKFAVGINNQTGFLVPMSPGG